MHKEHKIGPIYPLQIPTLLKFLNLALTFSKVKLKISGHNAANYIELSRDGVVITATRLRAGPSGVRHLEGEGDFLPNVHTVSGAHLASYLIGLGGFFLPQVQLGR